MQFDRYSIDVAGHDNTNQISCCDMDSVTLLLQSSGVGRVQAVVSVDGDEMWAGLMVPNEVSAVAMGDLRVDGVAVDRNVSILFTVEAYRVYDEFGVMLPEFTASQNTAVAHMKLEACHECQCSAGQAVCSVSRIPE